MQQKAEGDGHSQSKLTVNTPGDLGRKAEPSQPISEDLELHHSILGPLINVEPISLARGMRRGLH